LHMRFRLTLDIPDRCAEEETLLLDGVHTQTGLRLLWQHQTV